MTSEPRVLPPYLKREPVTLAVLTGLAVISILAVTALSHIYDAQQQTLAERWAAQGVDDLNAGNYKPAVTDFHTALAYSRDNAAYQLSLAQALMGLKLYDEAHAYLINLWEREPDNGMVSLELARIAVKKNETTQAMRFYHNSIYATWTYATSTGDQDAQRRRVRLELIAYLMRIGAKPQADAELIDLAAMAGETAAVQDKLGGMFAQVDDYQRALEAYRMSLRLNRRDHAAMAGAGYAAYELAEYRMAEQYLAAAVTADPRDEASAQRLKMTEFVLHWDPFMPQLSDDEKNRIVLASFATAGARLKACAPSNAPEQALQQSWSTLTPQISERSLRRHPDLIGTAMNLVFDIERQTASNCGAQTTADQALLLIANLHEER